MILFAGLEGLSTLTVEDQAYRYQCRISCFCVGV